MRHTLTSAAAIVMAALAPAAALAGTPRTVSSGKLLNLTEERYSDFHLFGPESCVNRDYTVDAGDRVLVIRHSTCMPHRDPALKVVIGRDIQYTIDEKRDRVGLLDTKNKVHWYKLFKVIEKPKEVK